jgi:hypothetical protein
MSNEVGWLVKRLFVPLLLTGCGNVQVRSEVAPEANLTRYRSYAWAPIESGADRPISILDQRVRRALAPQLAKRGLYEASESPDFLIAYHMLRERKTAVSDWGNGLQGWTPEVATYTDGTFIVDFIDPHTNTIFWRGTARHAIEPHGDVDVARLEKAANQLAAKYPSAIAAR